MTRGRYLDLLEKYLRTLPRERVREIIADIYAHFDEGNEAGLSEEEIAEGLGDPGTVAREYLQLYASECTRDDAAEARGPHMELPRIGWAGEEPYNERWSFAIDETKQLLIELKGVNLEVRTDDIYMVQAEFQGFRAPDREGNYPYIELSEFPNGVRAREVHPAIGSVGGILGGILGGFPRLRGTLTMTIPRKIGVLTSRVSSGNQSIEDVTATNLSLESTSGGAAVYRTTAHGAFVCQTHSGNQTVEDISCGNGTFGSTSGAVSVRRVEACGFNASSHSGGIKAAEIRVKANAAFSATSGGLSLNKISARQLETSQHSGGLDAEEIEITGDAAFSATSGHIKLKRLAAHAVRVQCHSGGISLEHARVQGKIHVESTSGSIRANDVTAESLALGSSSGSIKLTETSAEAMSAGASSGSIHAHLLRGANVEASAASGSVEIRMPGGTGFTYGIETASGGIHVDFPAETSEKAGRRSAHGVVGDGAYKISVRTSSGSVRIRPA